MITRSGCGPVPAPLNPSPLVSCSEIATPGAPEETVDCSQVSCAEIDPTTAEKNNPRTKADFIGERGRLISWQTVVGPLAMADAEQTKV